MIGCLLVDSVGVLINEDVSTGAEEVVLSTVPAGRTTLLFSVGGVSVATGIVLGTGDILILAVFSVGAPGAV